MNKLGELAKRIGQLLLVLFLVTLFVAFLMNLLPADTVDIMLPGQPEEFKAIIRKELGLDKGFFGYYFQWLGNFVRGDFGSFYFAGGSETVSSHLGNALPSRCCLCCIRKSLRSPYLFHLDSQVLTAQAPSSTAR